MVSHKVNTHPTLVFIMKILIFLSYKNKGDTIPPPPVELCGAHVLLVFLHMFFVPAWFCMNPGRMVLSTTLFNSAKEISNVP
jgi:hypothetical protein